VRRDGAAPTGPADPAAVAFDLAPTAHSYTDTTVTPNVHYFYALYSYDAFGNPSATAATGDATPLAPAEPPVITPPVITPPVITPPVNNNPGTKLVVKGLLNPNRLTPVKGTTLRSLRPLLKWKGSASARSSTTCRSSWARGRCSPSSRAAPPTGFPRAG